MLQFANKTQVPFPRGIPAGVPCSALQVVVVQEEQVVRHAAHIAIAQHSRVVAQLGIDGAADQPESTTNSMRFTQWMVVSYIIGSTICRLVCHLCTVHLDLTRMGFHIQHVRSRVGCTSCTGVDLAHCSAVALFSPQALEKNPSNVFHSQSLVRCEGLFVCVDSLCFLLRQVRLDLCAQLCQL